MEFAIVSGYYDRYKNAVTNCRILAVKNGKRDELTSGTGAGLEVGTVKDGVFYAGGGDWYIGHIEDFLGSIRDPREGEEILSLTAKNRNCGEIEEFEDLLDRVYFEARDNKVEVVSPDGRERRPIYDLNTNEVIYR